MGKLVFNIFLTSTCLYLCPGADIEFENIIDINLLLSGILLQHDTCVKNVLLFINGLPITSAFSEI